MKRSRVGKSPYLAAAAGTEEQLDAVEPIAENGHVSASVSPAQNEQPTAAAMAENRRRVAEFCRVLGERLTGQSSGPGAEPAQTPALPHSSDVSTAAPADPAAGLAPRAQEAFDRLLLGDSEKQIALRMGVSPHTVHVYVKAIYRHFKVCSRGELLAQFVSQENRGR